VARLPLAKLPDRYRKGNGFVARLNELLNPDTMLLEIGPGGRPVDNWTIAAEYVTIEPGRRTAHWSHDAETYNPALAGLFTLAVAYDVVEHLRDTAAAFENVRRYLGPGGVFLAHFSGRRSIQALANRLTPERLGRRLLRREEPKYPARYDRCVYSELMRLLTRWSKVKVAPLYLGAEYFSFSATIERTYLLYENRILNRPNLATHYLLEAQR
jgi:SAM-dependent methyltransferase